MSQGIGSKPSIFNYLDLVQYLRDYFSWRKQIVPSFTYSAWTDELGLGSKTILRFILQKKRSISPQTAALLKAHFGLQDEESTYFDVLLSYTQAGTDTARRSFGATLVQLQRGRYRQEELKPEVAARDELGPVLLTLLTFDDVPCEPGLLSRLLGIEEEKISALLEQFERDGLIQTSSSSAAPSFRIPAAPIGALRKFHAYWLERAKQAMNLEFQTRTFRSLKFALTEEDYADALKRIDEFALSILNRYHRNSLEGARLYMFEGALFPVSERHHACEPKKISTHPSDNAELRR